MTQTYRIDVATTNNGSAMKLPSHLLVEGGSYSVELGPGGVTVTGNQKGLLYLAEVLVQLALAGYRPEFHVHLPLKSVEGGPNVDARPELTLFAAE